MLNQYRPGTILALLCVLMGGMYWLIFAVCTNVGKHLNPRGDFIHHWWFYLLIGLLFPIIGISGGIVNAYKDEASDIRPAQILFFGILFVLGSLVIDVFMIVDLFSGGSTSGGPAD